MDELERDLLERASRCHSPTKRSLPLRCFQMVTSTFLLSRTLIIYKQKENPLFSLLFMLLLFPIWFCIYVYLCFYFGAREQLLWIEQDPAKFTPTNTRFQRGSCSIHRRRFWTSDITSIACYWHVLCIHSRIGRRWCDQKMVTSTF